MAIRSTLSSLIDTAEKVLIHVSHVSMRLILFDSAKEAEIK